MFPVVNGAWGQVVQCTLTCTSFNKVGRIGKGSLSAITDPLGAIVQELSYDAWGQRRNGATWGDLTALARMGFDTARTPRGYTGHEMLDDVGIIHMNGQVYDPHLGRFLHVSAN